MKPLQIALLAVLLTTSAYAKEREVIVNVVHCGSDLQKHLDAGCKIIGSNSYEGTQKFILSCPENFDKNFVFYCSWAKDGYCAGDSPCGCSEIVMTKEEAKDIDKELIRSYRRS